MTQITRGRVVDYHVRQEDADDTNRRRDHARGPRSAKHADSGAVVHVGNHLELGDILPMIVVATWGTGRVNGQAFLDGNDSLWVTSAQEGEGPGQWSWPVRV